MTEKGFFSLRRAESGEEKAIRGRKLMKPFGKVNRDVRRVFNGFCPVAELGFQAWKRNDQTTETSFDHDRSMNDLHF